MPISILELFSIGIGPSSSHTVGPMRAAKKFTDSLLQKHSPSEIQRITVDLYGSLAMTGKGHATDIAILLGLEGKTPEAIDPSEVASSVERIRTTQTLLCQKDFTLQFIESRDLLFQKGMRLPFHSNAMKFSAFTKGGALLVSHIYYSVGGGFVVGQEEIGQDVLVSVQNHVFPHPFKTYAELAEHCEKEDCAIHEIVWRNELSKRPAAEVSRGIFERWRVMQECVKRGCKEEGYLPGGLQVKRRASGIYKRLTEAKHPKRRPCFQDPAEIFDWVSLFALAVNEENAAGGKVVTAPTNGASGVIPAVLHYYQQFTENPTEEGILRFFLTATAIGILYKEGASLSAAEMGCQGEVGVACSMAAGGLVAALGGTNDQVENAAEIGMEHNLGLTCDPIAGLVQIPCIERNTMGAIKAINAARLALWGAGEMKVTLDQVIATMRHTGQDMKSIYKETSEGGLAIQVAVNLPEC